MRSLYDESEARRFVDSLALGCPTELAERVYTSRLLGAEPALVLHGGGNTSVKGVTREIDGRDVDVLYVKGSGWDLASIEPRGFPACRLEPLLACSALDELDDESMVRALRSQMLDPTSPTPSVEALLHAFVPGRFVDHTHSNAVLTIVDQPDGRERALEVWGDELLFVPYVMPGFALAREVFAMRAQLARTKVMVLDKHGIFTWGDSARESYESMIAAVTAAEDYVARRVRSVSVARRPPLAESERRRLQRRLSPVLRGAMYRRRGLHHVATWRDSDPILSLLSRQDAADLTAIGTLTPDHVIRTKPRPLFLPADVVSASSDAQLTEAVDHALDDYASWYEAYFEENSSRHSSPFERLPATPCLVAAADLGVLSIATSISATHVAADIYHYTAGVIEQCDALGEFRPVEPSDLFDVEYWSLEQAKLGKATKGAPLSGRVVLVTGGASGIGLATARLFLELGACVVVADRSDEGLASARDGLRAHGGHLVAVPCDVTKVDAVDAVVDAAVSAFGGLDVVVSNAGTAPTGTLHDSEGDGALRASLEVNLLGHQNVARAASRVLLQQGSGGCLLFNASKSAFNPGPGFGPYAVAKAGVVALMKQYAVDLGSAGIRSNAINADRVRTHIFSDELVAQRASARGLSVDSYFRANLLQRETTASDVAEAFAFLATAEATTGTVLTVDGGNAAAFPR